MMIMRIEVVPLALPGKTCEEHSAWLISQNTDKDRAPRPPSRGPTAHVRSLLGWLKIARTTFDYV